MTSHFDKYVGDYRDIINRVARVTGERYEYFVQLRIDLMKAKIRHRHATAGAIRILDFGCGIGATEIFIKDRFPEAEVLGIDESAESIKAAEQLGLPNVRFDVMGSSRLPYEGDSLDLIYSNGTFHHIEHHRHMAILAELRRVLRPGGDLFIFENNPYNPLMVRAMRRNPFDQGTEPLAAARLKQGLTAAGFRYNTTNYYLFYPRWLKLLRPTERYLRWLPVGAQYFVWVTK